jgi:hypothetical protein
MSASSPQEPLPRAPLGRRLCETFPYLWQAIVRPNEADAQWQTITKYPLRPRSLWMQWQDAAQLVGLRFDHTTAYGLIDIDIDSPYHPKQDSSALPLIQAALETIGIYRTVLITSSWSGGLHLYLPLPAEVPTFGFAIALKQCLEAQGLAISQGQLETFPNAKTYAKPGTYIEYNAHRLPLQPASGSFLLDSDHQPIGADLGQFFHQWDQASAAQDIDELTAAISTAKINRRSRSKKRAIVAEWQRDLQTEMADGWTGPGQTNHLLKTIACYGVVFEGLEGSALETYVNETAIALPGYAQWCGHQHEIDLRSRVWANAAANYYWKLGDPPKREGNFHQPTNTIVPFNVARSEEAQQRIKDTVEQLIREGSLPATPTSRAAVIAQQGGVSLKTLYRHIELWHPNHGPTMAPTPEMPLLNQQGKILEPEPVLAIPVPPSPIVPDLPEPLSSGEFYTSQENMKGKPLPKLSFNSPILDSDKPPRPSVSPTAGTPIALVSPLQLLLELDSQSQTGTMDDYPQERSP